MQTEFRDETLHRLYVGVGKGHIEEVIDEAKTLVTGATFITGSGIWEGVVDEHVLIVEVADVDDVTIRLLARRLCRILKQDCVLHTVARQQVRLLA